MTGRLPAASTSGLKGSSDIDFLQATVLGLIQGATEFLPVSSSAHLAIIEYLWRMPESARLGLAAALHAGTALSLIVFFGRRLVGIIRGAFDSRVEVRQVSIRFIGLVALATVPAVLVGLLLGDVIDRAFSSPATIAGLLLVTGALLYATRLRPGGDRPLDWRRALVIGIAQAAAILPGISRSGATIAVGLLLGLGRDEAFEFSFLLSVPVVVAAAARELVRLDRLAFATGPLVLGIFLAFLSGIGALLLVRRAVVGRRLYLFAFYCWLAGLVGLALVR